MVAVAPNRELVFGVGVLDNPVQVNGKSDGIVIFEIEGRLKGNTVLIVNESTNYGIDLDLFPQDALERFTHVGKRGVIAHDFLSISSRPLTWKLTRRSRYRNPARTPAKLR